MAQPTRSGTSPILPALAGAVAAVAVVGGAWLALRGGDDTAEVATDASVVTTSVEPEDIAADPGGADGSDTTTPRETEDTTDGTTIDDVPLSEVPPGAPESFVAVTSETFDLVRVDSQTGAILDQLGSWGLGGDGGEPLQALQFVELAPDGTIYVDDCCEPAYGTTFVVTDGFDPQSTPGLSGLAAEISPDGTRLARSSQGSAISIADRDGNAFGFFGDPDYSGAVLTPLTWIDSSTLVVKETDADGETLQILDVSDPSSPSVIAERNVDGRSYLSADVRADGNVLVITRIENGSDLGEVIAEIIDSSTAEVIVDFNLPDDSYSANYDASGRFVVIARSNGQLDWYGGGERGVLGTGFISADW